MRTDILATTTFRLTLLASIAFVLLSVGGLRVLYWSMLSVIDRQINGALDREFADMNAAYARGGLVALKRTVADRASPHEDALRVYLLQAPGGTLTGNLSAWPDTAPQPGKSADIEIPHTAGSARVSVLAFDDDSRLLVGRSLSERENFVRIFDGSAAGVFFADLLLGAAIGVLLARYAQRRLAPINATAEEVLRGNLSGRIRVTPEGGDEYDQLARNINAMLTRIEQLVETVRGVTEHIAHDLRTPLNRLRGRLEVALMGEHTADEYKAVLERAIGQSETIVDTFNGILKVARIESGTLALERKSVNLAELVAELVELYEPFAEEAGVTVESRLNDARGEFERGVYVLGDAHLISQAAANLLDNAIKYSPSGGKVVITALRRTDGIGLSIDDGGRGIPPEKRNAILQRFVRLVGTRDKQGFGLGLSFVAAVARWHGAKLLMEDNNPGLKVTLLFPADRIIGG